MGEKQPCRSDSFPSRPSRRLRRAPGGSRGAAMTCSTSSRRSLLGIVEGLTEYRAGVVDRAPAAGAALLRLRRRGIRQHLRGADPVRRDPGAAVDLFRPAVGLAVGMFTDRGGAALRDRHPDRVPARRRGRRAAARLHQDGAVQSVDRVRLADRRRPRAGVGRQPRSQAALPRRARRSRCRCISSSACSSARHDPGRVALGRDDRVGHAARRRPARRRRVLVLARDADDGGRLRVRPLQEPGR